MFQITTDEEYRYSIFPDMPFGVPEHEFHDEQWAQIFFLFGQATLRAQAYEDALARFVVAAEKRWQRSGMSAAQIWRLTLGRLQNEYKRYCVLRDSHDQQMAQAVAARNSLAHNFYRRRMKHLVDADGRNKIIRELQNAIELFILKRNSAEKHPLVPIVGTNLTIHGEIDAREFGQGATLR